MKGKCHRFWYSPPPTHYLSIVQCVYVCKYAMEQTIWEVITGIIYFRKENKYYSYTFVGFQYTSAAPQRPVLGTAPFQVATP